MGSLNRPVAFRVSSTSPTDSEDLKEESSMTSKMKKALIGTAMLAGVGATAYGCAVIGTVQFTISFVNPNSGQALNCLQAQLANVQFQFFDQALSNLLRTQVVQPCTPQTAMNQYSVSIDLGPYLVRVQGLNANQTICYSADIQITVQGGKTDTYDLRAVAPMNRGDCVYPM
jgi:hypothetical protein